MEPISVDIIISILVSSNIKSCMCLRNPLETNSKGHNKLIHTPVCIQTRYEGGRRRRGVTDQSRMVLGAVPAGMVLEATPVEGGPVLGPIPVRGRGGHRLSRGGGTNLDEGVASVGGGAVLRQTPVVEGCRASAEEGERQLQKTDETRRASVVAQVGDAHRQPCLGWR